MLLINLKDVKKSYGDRILLEIDNLKIYDNDRIGIIGNNGAGKSTLLKMIIGEEGKDSGDINLYGDFAYVSQLEDPSIKTISGEFASKFNIANIWSDSFSGGEKTRFKLAVAIENYKNMLLVDEPTNNLDIEGVELITKRLSEYDGGLVLISHDRFLLDNLCNKILEIEDGKIKIYNGNYSDYKIQKDNEIERMEFEYNSYINEKRRLERLSADIAKKSNKVRTTPKRMGNSEARLHKMGGQVNKKKLDNTVKSIDSRIEHLEVKEKPKEEKNIKIDILEGSEVYSKILISANKLNKSFKDKIIFKNSSFSIYNGKKIGLIGPNGSGKTTLINMIMSDDDSIKIAKGVKLGYFSQDLNILDEEKSILENVMESSGYNEEFIRLLLSRLLFKGDTVYKLVKSLSGGERVKVSLAKILLEDTNFLILDEPTNYLDIKTMEVLEDTLKNYNKTLLIVSHDREFIDAIVDEILIIEDNKIIKFMGNYKDYQELDKNMDNKKIEEEIMILENKINDLIGKISIPSVEYNIEELDNEYKNSIVKLRELKQKIK